MRFATTFEQREAITQRLVDTEVAKGNHPFGKLPFGGGDNQTDTRVQVIDIAIDTNIFAFQNQSFFDRVQADVLVDLEKYWVLAEAVATGWVGKTSSVKRWATQRRYEIQIYIVFGNKSDADAFRVLTKLAELPDLIQMEFVQ
jgi:hypothetical protein